MNTQIPPALHLPELAGTRVDPLIPNGKAEASISVKLSAECSHISQKRLAYTMGACIFLLSSRESKDDR